MSIKLKRRSVNRPAGRKVAVEVVDEQGRPVGGATIVVSIDDRPAGEIHTGSGSPRPFVIFVNDPKASVELMVKLAGSRQRMLLTAGMSSARFVFPDAPFFGAKMAPRLVCPDGTTGFLCVTCTDESGSEC